MTRSVIRAQINRLSSNQVSLQKSFERIEIHPYRFWFAKPMSLSGKKMEFMRYAGPPENSDKRLRLLFWDYRVGLPMKYQHGVLDLLCLE